MTEREHDSAQLEGKEPEEKEPKLLDNPDFIDLDEEWDGMVEQSITDERQELMSPSQADIVEKLSDNQLATWLRSLELTTDLENESQRGFVLWLHGFPKDM